MSVQHGMALQQLQMYGAAPLHDMQLDDLECGAVDRMKGILNAVCRCIVLTPEQCC